MGALDDNGVWRYGEDDAATATLFSELLDIGFGSVSDALGLMKSECVELADTGAVFGAGWVLGTGANTPRIVREGKKRTLYGTLTHSGTASITAMFTLALEDRPLTTAERGIGLAAYRPPAGGTGALSGSMMLAAGVVGAKSMSASAPVAYVFDLAGLSWWRD